MGPSNATIMKGYSEWMNAQLASSLNCSIFQR